jgi:phosphoribosyl 1,2-cyclic phosphodiesterase
MSLFICSLNSGSNGNCYYVGNNNEAVLIDAGLSCRETERRMKLSGLQMEKVKAIFISHEHSDHISGLAGISKKYQLPVYITDATFRSSNLPLEKELICSFRKNNSIVIGSLTIIPFSKHHDAADPFSFMVSGNGLNIGIITDIGHACKQVIKYFSQCHAAFLEANYCPDMLANGNYPYHLQKRISSDEGHLSNKQALELFLHYKSPELRLLILSHLSKNNNKPELVQRLFAQHAGNTEIVIASRYEAGQVFHLGGTTSTVLTRTRKKKFTGEKQISLF